MPLTILKTYEIVKIRITYQYLQRQQPVNNRRESLDKRRARVLGREFCNTFIYLKNKQVLIIRVHHTKKLKTNSITEAPLSVPLSVCPTIYPFVTRLYVSYS